MEDPLCLATCSFDGNVKVWSLMGELLGSLVLGKGPEWKLKVNKQERIRAEREAAKRLYEEIEHVSYKEMIENKANSTKKKDKQQASNPLLKALDRADEEAERARLEDDRMSDDSEDDEEVLLPRESIRHLETLQ